MPTNRNVRSGEEFVAALLKQQNFEGIVENVGYVKCQIDNTWQSPHQPSPSIPRGRAMPRRKYTVSIERIDKSKIQSTEPYYKRAFPKLTTDAMKRAISSSSGRNKQVQLGKYLYATLLPEQDFSVDINYDTGIVSICLPKDKKVGDDFYPQIGARSGIPDSSARNRKTFEISLNDIQQDELGYNARYLLIGDQKITSKPPEVEIDYWDMLQNFREYRPYIIGNKFTISFYIEYSVVGGENLSIDFTWLFDGKDRSIYPYMTTTFNSMLTTGGGLSAGVNAGFGQFLNPIDRLNRNTLKGVALGGEVGGVYKIGGAVGGSRSIWTKDIWYSEYASLGIGFDGSPVTGLSWKVFTSITTEALHLSPEAIRGAFNSK